MHLFNMQKNAKNNYRVFEDLDGTGIRRGKPIYVSFAPFHGVTTVYIY